MNAEALCLRSDRIIDERASVRRCRSRTSRECRRGPGESDDDYIIDGFPSWKVFVFEIQVVTVETEILPKCIPGRRPITKCNLNHSDDDGICNSKALTCNRLFGISDQSDHRE